MRQFHLRVTMHLIVISKFPFGRVPRVAERSGGANFAFKDSDPLNQKPSVLHRQRPTPRGEESGGGAEVEIRQ